MTARVKDILGCLNTLAPFKLAEPWDNVGLLVGNTEQEVTAILVGLDPRGSLIDEAIALGANTVITHHPAIFKPLPAIDTATPIGRLLEKALANHISLIGCHTNFDSSPNGVSAMLAEHLGLLNHSPLIPAFDANLPNAGLGRIGSYRMPKTPDEFFSILFDILRLESVSVAGNVPKNITTVAVCGGSGSDLALQAKMLGAEIYVSAEIKHDVAIWAIESDFCIVDGTHYATEKPAIDLLVQKLKEAGSREKWNISIFETKTERHPFVKIDRNIKQ